jgi:hypothetical protein
LRIKVQAKDELEKVGSSLNLNFSLPCLIGRWRGEAKRSLTCSGGDARVERGFIGLIRCLGLDKGMQALVLLGSAKELEGDAASADRTDHRGHFKRQFAFTERQLQIEDVIGMDKGFTPDDTATHREIEYRSLTADLASGEGKIEPHGNSEVFASIDWMRGMIQPKTGRQKSMTA